MASSEFILPKDTPAMKLDASNAFQGLTEREKFYAHYLSQASFYGGLIVLLQTSPESPQIYRLLQRINKGYRTAQALNEANSSSLSQDEIRAYRVYCSGFLANMGNYKGFGDTKFVPDLPVEKFEALIKACPAYNDELSAIWDSVKGPMYELTDKSKQLGLGDKGMTTYFSSNCEAKDSELVNKFFKEKNIEGYINRLIKTVVNGKTHYEIRNAGVESLELLKVDDYEGASFSVTSGDYGPLLAKVNENLKEALKHVANDNEKNMIEKYIESFQKGSLDAHKDGSRFWIKNKGPVIENYIGFIETYRDPVGMRGEFEGFVAMVNKEQSAKFQELVNQAEKLLDRLPWPKEFEKDTFLRPDFTSLDVLAFAGSGIPVGINIPNYDEIRQAEGFKNVNLGNVLVTSLKSEKPTPFVNEADDKLFKDVHVKSFEVQVGLHELLGHGSGKLLQKNASGDFNYPSDSLINPVTGQVVDKFYQPGETYDSVFTSLGSSYEECRAECVGLYLSCDREVLNIFGLNTDEKEAKNITYINWLSLLLSGIKGLEMYSPGTKAWKQAHSQARFVILRVLMEAGEGFISVKEVTNKNDGKPDLLLSMDASKVESVGKSAIGDFLKKLQVYKSTADIEQASSMYDKYSAVNNDDNSNTWLKWREIVIDRKQPRKILVQANTKIQDEKLHLQDYDGSHEGMIQSWMERFNEEESAEIDTILFDLYKKDQPFFQ